mmetsp:Transcript_80842/g.240929  ORF Transcript_80842/g.240929 Transcript_80842/m.240929 type:complete len:216 (-) Transcript_80842:602-1249(-)
MVTAAALSSQVREHGQRWVVAYAKVRSEAEEQEADGQDLPAHRRHDRVDVGHLPELGGPQGRRDDGGEDHVAPDDAQRPGAVGGVFEGGLAWSDVLGHELGPQPRRRGVGRDEGERPWPQVLGHRCHAVGNHEDVHRGHEQRKWVDTHRRQHLADAEVEGGPHDCSCTQEAPRHQEQGQSQLQKNRKVGHGGQHGHRHHGREAPERGERQDAAEE